ncbi:SanA/YdcF family protein [Spartinivicinus ruber]|uniref:SanA/YdcF family protein n=1 Tax=Spartinivicinus ruber TaxID=2683272 RepID=UPI0013CFD1C8|nr:ElyC/SanA/YdcF family protein [Spartinivicinus ruber]
MVCLLLSIDRYMSWQAKDRLFVQPEQLTRPSVALLLGTAKYFRGQPNLFYNARIDAAVDLYKAGKVKGFLVSGDNSREDYNEPEMIKADLVARGVPAELIGLDFAGFRTLDSVVRAKQVFGLNKLVIVSQPFHVERALFIADHYQLDAVGYVAADVSAWRWHLKVRSREVLARLSAWLDVKIINRSPKYLGAKETLAFLADNPSE